MFTSDETRTDMRKVRTKQSREQRVTAVARILRQQRFVKDVLLVLRAEERLASYSQGVRVSMGHSGAIDRALKRLTTGRPRRKRHD